ncbi:MAG TPA: hypothetical protein VME43_10430 [Bryobacteraceae bacterium]|nr:hypothetical protein [Bryobacteraceae bacterium]
MRPDHEIAHPPADDDVRALLDEQQRLRSEIEQLKQQQRQLQEQRNGQSHEGSALQPLSQAILMESFPPEKLGQALGMFALGVVVAARADAAMVASRRQHMDQFAARPVRGCPNARRVRKNHLRRGDAVAAGVAAPRAPRPPTRRAAASAVR